MDCVFCKIRDKQIPTKFIYEDEDVMVFQDIHPAKPVHFLIVPRIHIGDFVMVDDPTLFSKLFIIVQKMVEREGLKGKGFRIVINGGGAQLVEHLHIHLMGPVGKTASL